MTVTTVGNAIAPGEIEGGHEDRMTTNTPKRGLDQVAVSDEPHAAPSAAAQAPGY